jgi:hypothetical protein
LARDEGGDFSDGCLEGDGPAGGVEDELEALLRPRLSSRVLTVIGAGGGSGGGGEPSAGEGRAACIDLFETGGGEVLRWGLE